MRYTFDMDLSFIELKTLFLIVHLIGLALGVGGALISDVMFFKTIRDWRITKTEMEFLTIGSYAVGAGLVLLVVSGIAMFSLAPEQYLESSKFLAKMTVVAILAVNGLVLHTIQVPHLKQVAERRLSTRTAFLETRPLLLTSGVVSVVSWLSALILGAFRSIPFSYEMIISSYLAMLFLALGVAFVIRDFIIPTRDEITAQA